MKHIITSLIILLLLHLTTCLQIRLQTADHSILTNFEAEDECLAYPSTITKVEINTLNTQVEFYSSSDCVGKLLGKVDRNYTFSEGIKIKSFMLSKKFKDEPTQVMEYSTPPPNTDSGQVKRNFFLNILRKLFIDDGERKRNRIFHRDNKPHYISSKKAFKELNKYVKEHQK
ncbi:hypothetical protein K502DRAFT_351518 [Neoconidiobolus thromboides FSU 785]|nr:hypothetical protein K502DRAFT_351518 [Neoconidiobolus thromboides FSU 785]